MKTNIKNVPLKEGCSVSCLKDVYDLLFEQSFSKIDFPLRRIVEWEGIRDVKNKRLRIHLSRVIRKIRSHNYWSIEMKRKKIKFIKSSIFIENKVIEKE